MPPRRPLTDLCLIAVMKMLTPNDQLKTAQMSPRCAKLVRAANRRVKMLVIAGSDYFEGEKIRYHLNRFSLASKPSMQLLPAGGEPFPDYPMTTTRISKWNCLLVNEDQHLDQPTVEQICLTMRYYDSDQLPELSILSQLKVIVIRVGDRAKAVFQRSLEHHAASNVDLQVHLIGYDYDSLFGLSEPVRRRILRVGNFMLFRSSDDVSLLCRQLPSLTSVSVSCSEAPQLRAFFTALSTLSQLVHLKLVICWQREEGNQFVEPTQPLRPLAQLTSLKAFDLQLNLHSHEQMQWLKHLPVTMPRLQAIHLEAFSCASWGVVLDGYLRGGYSEDTSPTISTALKCLRATLLLLHPGVPQDRVILGWDEPYPTLKQAMPPRRPLTDLCVIAVMKMLTPNDQLKTAQMSPRCAILVRAANRRVKMLVIARSNDLEWIQSEINAFSLASKPSMRLLPAGGEPFPDYPRTTTRISKWNCLLVDENLHLDQPTVEQIFLATGYYGSDQLPELSILSQLKAIVIHLGDIADGVFLRSLEHHAAGNVDLQVHLHGYDYSRLFGLSEPVRRRFVRVCNIMKYYDSDNVSHNCRQLPSLTSVSVGCIRAPELGAFFTALSTLPQLVHLNMMLNWMRQEENQFVEPTRSLAHLTSLKALDLSLNLHSHELMQWLKHLPVTMPRLQVIHLLNFNCASCGVPLDGYLRGDYSEATSPSISTALKCLRATLPPLLHPGVPQDRVILGWDEPYPTLKQEQYLRYLSLKPQPTD
ncbi:hypothetical protein TYRP_017495 [Tyrophagus putrescentiae]|nr:hypothetical protein TYRP_017495 [Tyrophagus putrescentiae]